MIIKGQPRPTSSGGGPSNSKIGSSSNMMGTPCLHCIEILWHYSLLKEFIGVLPKADPCTSFMAQSPLLNMLSNTVVMRGILPFSPLSSDSSHN